MPRKCFLDTETCGLYGMPVIIQYAFDDGPIQIHEFWTRPIDETLSLIEEICECEVIGFNLTFDWFHICKIYTVFSVAKLNIGGDAYPDEHIAQIAAVEEAGRDGLCVKPKASFDLMLHARKTEFQSTMERSDIRIRRVPTGLAWSLAKVLEEKIQLESILFARKKNRLAPKWTVLDVKKSDGELDRDFKDIVLKFKPSVALKALALHVLKIDPDDILSFGDIEVDRHYWPAEVGYAPTAAAVKRLPKKEYAKRFKKKKPWPEVIMKHIEHWGFNAQARLYAEKDVEYTRLLYDYFDRPPVGDDDSELATSAAAVRWRGYAIDVPGIEELRKNAIATMKAVPNAPRRVKAWIGEVMSEMERKLFTSTGKVVLERMAATKDGERCPFGPCEHCNNTGLIPGPESAHRAFAVLEARKMKKEIELYDKLLLAGRFHASYKIIGALSGRMSGADGLNPQGIKRTKEVRKQFPLAFGKLKLRGGDFSGFEVVLAVAAYGDGELERDLQTCENCRDVQVDTIKGTPLAKEYLSKDAFRRYIQLKLKDEDKAYEAAQKDIAKGKAGAKPYVKKTEEQLATSKLKTFACPKCGYNKRMKIHALFGMQVYPGMSYDDIKATDGQADDKYNKSKSAVFALIYGGQAYTLMTRLGVPIEVAEEALQRFLDRYPGVRLAQIRIQNGFCSISQEGGIGSKIVWRDPEEYVESLLGFRRYFTLENRIVKAIFELAENPPAEWKGLKVKVRRRDRDQTISGAVQSALFGAAFQVQAGNMRAAANHEIQSSGAQITKYVQRKIWDIQPHGVHDWLVQPCNVHDEVLCPTAPEVDELVTSTVNEAVESFRERVPLIEFGWKPMESWASK